MFFNVAATRFGKSPLGKPLGTSLFEWKDHPRFPQIGTSKMIVTSYTSHPKKVSKDLGYFKNYALLNLLKLCKLYGRCKIQGAKTYLIWLQLNKNVALPF